VGKYLPTLPTLDFGEVNSVKFTGTSHDSLLGDDGQQEALPRQAFDRSPLLHQSRSHDRSFFAASPETGLDWVWSGYFISK